MWRRFHWIGLAVGLALVSLPGETAARGVIVEVLATELAPGEPVRILVSSPGPTLRLRARFLERDVDFHRVAEIEGRELWVGWSMIDLDQEPGLQEVSVWATLEAGRILIGARPFRVVAREFDEERLTVAQRYVEPPAEVQARLADERKRLNAIYARRGDPVDSLRAPFRRPVPGPETSTFGTRRILNGQPRSPHAGIDLRAPTGTPVVAPAAGEVVLSEDLYYSGQTVILDHGGGLFTILAHLSRLDVEVGSTVAAGDRLGLSGATGRVTAPHLHWGAKIGSTPFNPLSLLKGDLFAAPPVD